ncbi:MAG TPA: hypothetical protein DIW81_22120 [Planctomycetaceae bacterium]|nr:hypothetical protein [Rubinisphaera sp.]HCS54246.1 hypothetical protein [Planctomycetaceae bacterium]|tara:strand:+ start:606 stop:815 length:210 start_codon:yes stop_codon:yes gene_type:complete
MSLFRLFELIKSRSISVLHLDLEVGTSIEIDGYTITVLDIQNDEVFFQIDDPSTEDQVALSGDFARIPR